MHKSRLDALFAVSEKVPVVSVNPVTKVSDIYGAQTFNDKEMKARLPREAYEAFKQVARGDKEFDLKLAETVAEAVKNWAVSHGVTHFTHWFQPLTGGTAEKHDSFINHDFATGGVVEKFSASQLIQSEPDASSFPSGGMRSTFEARGYTAWDTSSPIFIVNHANAKILCIPSVFVSYTGHSLDTKTGLLRSDDALNTAACAMLAEMGEKGITAVHTTIGCEQEYFLIDKDFAALRPDLTLAGRTLLGAESPRGQQLEDHYFGAIPARVQSFMVEAETELYKLGVPVKTRHNEVAPSQFELAPIFEAANVASDHNMLTMETLRRVATKHGFVCLLHEKPFAGINGSGKHNNWSMATNTGDNLLEPGKTPHSNVRFIAVLSVVLNAVFKHQVALRAAIASSGNDHRLGANEAPPAIISAFLGTTLSGICETLEKGTDLSKVSAEQAMIQFGLTKLPQLPKDNTDRNRTSPFAFTGNKFEFRAVGSSQAIAFPVSVLNAAVAESMKEFTETLKKKKSGAVSTDSAVLEVAREFMLRSKAIRFEGNGYSAEWRQEAKSRGLYELLKTPESFAAFHKPEQCGFLIEQGVYGKEEIEAIIHVRLEQYAKYLDIEAKTLGMMIKQYVVPAAQQYLTQLGTTLNAATTAGAPCAGIKDTFKEVATATETLYTMTAKLAAAVDTAAAADGPQKVAEGYAETVAPLMAEIRKIADSLEGLVPDELWPLPKYREMLFLR
jgi:glutamine synthetase